MWKQWFHTRQFSGLRNLALEKCFININGRVQKSEHEIYVQTIGPPPFIYIKKKHSYGKTYKYEMKKNEVTGRLLLEKKKKKKKKKKKQKKQTKK